MTNELKVQTSTIIYAPVNRVWKALTDPELIKEYLFGTNTTTDWKKGSPITYSGVYQGKTYKDTGTIIDIIPEKLLHTTHYSSLSGKEDKPENYHHVIYELIEDNGRTRVNLTQDNISNEEELRHLQKNWYMVLDGMKKLLEKSTPANG
jgi:uncharacterized protein YndB with AHSA1/START domain